MPMETIVSHYITQFSDEVHVRAQQLTSRLKPHVQMKKMNGDEWAYDGMGTVEARELVARFNASTFDSIEFNRRKLSRREFVVTLPMDQFDVEGMLTDPQGKLASACVAAMERVFDKVVIDAMFADVQTGRTFGTTVTAAADGVRTVTATGGIDQTDMLTIHQNFIDDEVGNNTQTDVWMGITGKEHTAFLNIANLTSRDYSTQMALEKGSIVNAFGINLIKFGAAVNSPMLPVAASVRTSFAMVPGAMCVGIGRDWQITVKDRSELVNVRQLQVTGVLGAVRTEGKLIQKVTTTE